VLVDTLARPWPAHFPPARRGDKINLVGSWLARWGPDFDLKLREVFAVKVVDGEGMRAIDRAAIEGLGVPGPVLMENAGRQVARVARVLLAEAGGGRGRRVTILCGRGNNGGDGLVAARHLARWGAAVRVLLFADPGALSADAALNHQLLTQGGWGVELTVIANGVAAGDAGIDAGLEHLQREPAGADLIIDALLGTGVRGPVRPPLDAVIRAANAAGVPILAVDIPSGLDADSGRAPGEAARAAATVTFGLPKLGLVVHPGVEFAGRLFIADISLPPKALDRVAPRAELLTSDAVRGLLPPRPADGHKGTFGRAAVIAGSPGMTGAAALSAGAALAAGAGLVYLGCPQGLNDVLESLCPEVVTRPLPQLEDRTFSLNALPAVRDLIATVDAVALGPGLSRRPEALQLARRVAGACDRPLVLDADGLHAFAGKPAALASAGGRLVITPHPGELAALTGDTVAQVQADRLGAARRVAEAGDCVVVLKGARTIVAGPDGRAFINPTGNPGMATAGSGDVLTGCLAALLAQGMEPPAAACAAAYLHGLAGDLAAVGRRRGMVAGNILDALPRALDWVENGAPESGTPSAADTGTRRAADMAAVWGDDGPDRFTRLSV